jgi:hypothetical protein
LEKLDTDVIRRQSRDIGLAFLPDPRGYSHLPAVGFLPGGAHDGSDFHEFRVLTPGGRAKVPFSGPSNVAD